MINCILILLSYLIGSISTSILIGKIKYNLDIRNFGSKSTGATNAFRIFGSKFGTIVLLSDIIKGIICYYIGIFSQNVNLMYITSLFCIIGHMYPIWHGFRGGKGVSSFVGSLFMINPIYLIFSFLYFIYCLVQTKVVSISVIISLLVLTAISILTSDNTNYTFYVSISTILILIKHIPNINRYIKGTEFKI